jgi:hypothetical protein
MIYFLKLGSHGNLGNQLFQVAASLAQSFRLNTKLCLLFNNQEIFKCFDIRDIIVNNYAAPKHSYEEKFFHYCNSIDLILDETNLMGYFQSEKYFKKFSDKVRNNFKFKDNIIKLSEDYLKNLPNNLCAIHVRRGDYLNFKNVHPVQSMDYYNNSINYIKNLDNNVNFIIFSDDINWCIKNFNSNFIFCNIQNPFVEMCVMSKCNYHIIANSSFSWWGAYLSNSKKIISPKKWFEKDGPKNWNDIYCQDWIII